ncbi:MAG TPA: acyl-CoA dehydrogenase family protein [Bryobacteraceae bacterium]|jgi:alkylation response protein AidB-like acyl-CoA dehydrogenase|nr:acyl-CoA dehydrogenase family protein [Bryobacteraceae bacterium]
MATATVAIPKTKGGAFLIETRAPEEIFTPEDFTEEHLAIRKTTDEFFTKEIAPNIEAIRHQEHEVCVRILKKSAELGLTAVVIPEKFGGMEMDLTSMMLVAEGVSREGSYSAWHGAHTGIGTLPLLLFGNEEQRQRYLPKLAKAEMIAAYCLSEPQAGSDALAARTRADLTPDGKHYVLNGQKMWITNGGYADLYTVFAKVGGEKFTAFLVERSLPGVSTGKEEKKMGIKGSSTTAVFFDNVKVPVENVLGEVGRGHIIAFNILNLGRLKLGPFAQGGCRDDLAVSIKYAKERKAFGTTISTFGMIQHKLAEMAIRMYASESMTYRVVGSIEAQLEGFSWDLPNAGAQMLKGVEEFATECSYIKVFASETLDYVVDECVQIHGGYGFHQDYAVEHAYRDSRINRIFEGTNEINRLLATGMMLKRAQKGTLPLVEAVKKLQGEILSGPSPSAGGPIDLVANAKKAGLLALGVAYLKFAEKIEEQQEVVANITDMLMNAYAMESTQLRTEKLVRSGKNAENARDMYAVFSREAMDVIDSAGRTVMSACSEGDTLRTNLAVLKRFTKYEPVNAIALRRQIAARLIEAERFVV